MGYKLTTRSPTISSPLHPFGHPITRFSVCGLHYSSALILSAARPWQIGPSECGTDERWASFLLLIAALTALTTAFPLHAREILPGSLRPGAGR